MRLRSICLISIFVLSAILIASCISVSAQTVNNSSNSTSPPRTETLTQRSDFSYAIDPVSVSSFSDDQLNETFDKMSAQYSKNAVLFNNIGASFYQRKMYDKAEAAVRRAIILNDHPAFLTNLSIIYDNENRIPEAISAAQRAVTQAPKFVRARTQLCELMLVTKRNSDAVLCYDELIKITWLDQLQQTYYAVALIRAGDADRAISILGPLVRGTNPTALMFNTLGSAYFMKKRYSLASSTFKQGVEVDPDDASLRYNLAIVLATENDRAGALAQYSLMKSSNPALADQLYRGLNRDKIIYVNEAGSKK